MWSHRRRDVGGLGVVVVLCALLAATGAWPGTDVSRDAAAEGFYFVQLTDTHLGDKDHDEKTRQVVERINGLPMPIAFVAHTGDIMADRMEDLSAVTNGLAILAGLKAPIHFVPGNHDILPKRHSETAQIYTNHFGGLLTRREYHGVVFLFLYTEPLAKAFDVPSYEPLTALEAELKAADGRPVVVFHHTPSVEDFYRNRMHAGWRRDLRDRWVALLNRYGVKAVIAGHFHRDEHHWLGDVPLYVCPAVAGYWGRQVTFRIYEYRDGHVGYRSQYAIP